MRKHKPLRDVEPDEPRPLPLYEQREGQWHKVKTAKVNCKRVLSEAKAIIDKHNAGTIRCPANMMTWFVERYKAFKVNCQPEMPAYALRGMQKYLSDAITRCKKI